MKVWESPKSNDLTSKIIMGTLNRYRTLAAMATAMSAVEHQIKFRWDEPIVKEPTEAGVREVYNEIAHAKAKLSRHRGKGKTRKQRKESRNG
jgi:hypothetical protein